MNSLRKPPNTDNIKPLGQLIAYDIALGLTLGDIATHLDIPLDEVKKVARGNLVQKKVKEFQLQLEERLLKEASEDPVRQFLHRKGMTFAETIVNEAQNDGDDASASTRLKAAQLGLQFGGRSSESEREKAPTVVVQITAGKLKMAEDIQQEVLDNVPDYVD